MTIFIEEIKRLTSLEESLQKKFNTICTVRLIVAFAAIAFFLLAFMQENSKYFYLVFVSALLFIWFVIQHAKTEEALKRTRCLIRINEEYVARRNGKWTEFKDCGDEFLEADHAYAADLDIFGTHSLFQFISAAGTFFGRNHLARLLSRPDKKQVLIKQRQGAVKELADKVDFCRNLQCETKLRNSLSDSPEKLIAYAERNDSLFKYKWIEWFLIFLTTASLITVLLLVMKISVPVAIPVSLLSIQSILTLFGGRCRDILAEAAGIKGSLETYRKLLEVIEREDFQDDCLVQLRGILCNKEISALAGLKKLDAICGAIDIRYSPLIHFPLNVGLLWDYHCAFELEAWKEQYGRHIQGWLEAIGRFEAYVSLAVIPQISAQYVFPELCTEEMKFSAKNLGHPLINQDKRVTNNIEMNNSILIITGSNMSGKTTMLRTVGINLVLAYAGAPVIASSMNCGIMSLYTSMRIKDDLNGGISTFYAELLRIKKIVECSKLRQPMLFLLDEIFRGTNSKDRIIGAKSVINNLNEAWIMGIVSTHDFELCDLEEEDKIKIQNFHFTEHYVNDQICFDYRIKNGRCQSTNAKQLMKLAGIELKE